MAVRTLEVSPMDNVDLSGKVALVTGATSGVGRAAALALARLGASVVGCGRDPERAQALEAEGVTPLLGDLSTREGVSTVAEGFRERHDRLHILLHNAGAIFQERQLTPEGLERTFAINHMGPFRLTRALEPLLVESAPARVVVVSSDAHKAVDGLRHSDLGCAEDWGMMGFKGYAHSKLCNLLFMRELSRRLSPRGVTVNAMHPGFVASGIARNGGALGRAIMWLSRPLQRSPEQGAETAVWLAADPEVEGETGGYYADLAPLEMSVAAQDDVAARRLWELSMQLDDN